MVATFMIDDDDINDTEETLINHRQKRKKTMILLLPLLIVIGISVGVYFAFNRNYDSFDDNYNIVKYNKDSTESVTVFYDLPEIKTVVCGEGINLLSIQGDRYKTGVAAINMYLPMEEKYAAARALVPYLLVRASR